MVVRINLYNGLYKRSYMCKRAAEYLYKGSFFVREVVGYHRDTSPIIIFNLISQEIRTKCILSWNLA